MDAIADIKARLQIQDLVAPFLELRKAGRNFKALCPFHQEKTPSFVISPDKGIAYCFGCHKGGDIFKFTMEREGLSFGEALKLLAEKAGVELPRGYKGPERGKRERLFLMHRVAGDFFKEYLNDSKEGETALKYLIKKRGFSESIVRDFSVGLAPDEEHALTARLLKENFSREEILESGLGIASVNSLKDRFRGRLIFPIADSQGRVVAFGARALSEAQEPKYLNSPETSLYSKSNILFAYDRAKESMRKEDRVMIVEGYMDVMRAHEKGFMNVVASCGTALTSDQVELIRRHTENIVLFFDNDEAGRQATLRSWPIATAKGMNVFVVRPRKSKDPDEWMVDNKEEVRDALQAPVPFFDFFLADVSKRYVLSDINEQKKALEEILPLMAQVGNKIELDHYIQRLSRLIKASPDRLYDTLFGYGRKQRPLLRKANVEKTSQLTLTKYLIGLFLQYPWTFDIARLAGLSQEDFPDIEKSLYKIMEGVYNNRVPNDETHEDQDIFSSIPEEFQEQAKLLSLFAETQNHTLTRAELEAEVKAATEKFRKIKREELKRELHYQLKLAEEQGDSKKQGVLIESIQRAIKEF